ncbi:MAG: hypothetical protein FWB85_03130 [Chitinispirillia bacterium]|nr:hypothetical protein [Chitinispirillia bacterium]
MEKRGFFRRKRNLAHCAVLLSAFCALFAADLRAQEDAGGPRAGLQGRIESLELEIQNRRRQGKPIEDLEAAAALLRDSVSVLRGSAAYTPASPDGPAEERGGGFSLAALWEGALSFKPRGMFDWVIVGTGFIALLSGTVLIIGLIVGSKKRPAPKNKDKVVTRMDLRPTGQQPVIPGLPNIGEPDKSAPPVGLRHSGTMYNNTGRVQSVPADAPPIIPPLPPPPDPMANLQSLMDSLRKAAPPPEEKVPQPPKPLPPPPPPKPRPLIVDAPDNEPPVPVRPAGAEPPGSVNDRILAASQEGLSDLEISRRYQIGIDQVRLILRMSK